MPDMGWRNAQKALESVRAEASLEIGENVAVRLNELTIAFLTAPIEHKADAAAALDLGLACIGTDIEEDSPGHELIRRVMAHLRAGA